MDRNRVTIEDVASAAGVSVATVSRALRGLPNVAVSTRAHIASIAEDLRYVADPMAIRLATGRSRTIGCVVPLLSGWYFAQVVAGMEAVCAETGFDLVVQSADSAERLGDLAADAPALQRRVDGLVMVDYALTDDHVTALRGAGIEVVSIGAATGGFCSVGIDDAAVGETAARYLLELGHTRIGLIGSTRTEPFRFAVPDLRASGFRTALADAGIDHDPALFADGNFSVGGGAEAMTALLNLSTPPTAVFALSDEMAFGARRAAERAGCDIPDDISLLGVDDHELSSLFDLTTIAQDPSAIGVSAARQLIARVDPTQTSTTAVDHVTHPVTLVERGTTGPVQPGGSLAD